MKLIFPVLGVGGIALLASTASCGLLGAGSQPQAAQPVIVTNNIPSGSDSGIMVLLTVAGIGAFLLLGIAIALAFWGNNQKQRANNAEKAIARLTGREVDDHLRLAISEPISTQRIYSQATPLANAEARRELAR